MNKHDLSQIRHLKNEIESLKHQIDNIEPYHAIDSVTGSSPHFPYTAHSIRIEGMDIQDYDRRVIRLKNQLQRRHDELLDKRVEIEEFIDTIDDSLARQMIEIGRAHV